MNNLSKELATVDWYYLGIKFNLQPDQLHSIQASNPAAGIQRWKCDMFDLWLRSHPTAAWEDVVKALQQMEEYKVAETIQQKYLTSGATGMDFGSWVDLFDSRDDFNKAGKEWMEGI